MPRRARVSTAEQDSSDPSSRGDTDSYSDTSDTGTRAEGLDTSGPGTNDTVTRSEAELHASTERVEAGRAVFARTP